MRETPAEIGRLKDLLDRSAAGAGPHLSGIITGERRLTAGQVCALLQGLRLLVVATVTADGRPLAGPVDGFSCTGRSASARHVTRCGCATWPRAPRSARVTCG